MKISSLKKSVKNFSLFSATIIFSTFIAINNQALAWNGYDYDNKTEIEIESGNLVREGLPIQFYDLKADQYHTAKILYMDSVAGGTRIQLQDLDSKKERTFIMQD